MKLADWLEQRLAEETDMVNGIINIGASEAIDSRMMAKLIRRFSKKYPLVQFHLLNEMADSVKDRLDKGLADISLLLGPIDVHIYEYLCLPLEQTQGILMCNDHSLADRQAITPEDIADCALILPLRMIAVIIFLKCIIDDK